MPVRIPIENLAFVSPYENCVWQGIKTPIKRDEISLAIDSKRLISVPLPDNPTRVLAREEHVSRIAHLAVNGWEDAIHLDVGVPSLGCVVEWPLVDGNHRLAAAMYRGYQDILAEVSGQVDYAEELLGVKI